MNTLAARRHLIILLLMCLIFPQLYLTSAHAGSPGLIVESASASNVDGSLASVVYGENINGDGAYVAVGAKGRVVRSGDGLNWTRIILPASLDKADWSSVAYGSGKYVAVGTDRSSGTALAKLIESPDGLSWTEHAVTGSTLQKVRYVAEDAAFYAAGAAWNGNNSQDQGIILRSADGETWSQWGNIPRFVKSGSSSSSAFYLVDFVKFKGNYVASTNLFTGYAYSTNGSSWTTSFATAILGDGSLGFSIYNNQLYANYKWQEGYISTNGVSFARAASFDGTIGVGQSGSALYRYGKSGKLDISTDNGVNWTPSAKVSNISILSFASNGTSIVAVTGALNSLLVTADGSQWQRIEIDLKGVASGGGKWVAVGEAVPSDGNESADGGLFTSEAGFNQLAPSTALPPYYTFSKIVYGEGRFVAGGSKLGSSADGVNWATYDLPAGASGKVVGLEYGNGVFVAVTDGDDVLTSPDGINWSLETELDGAYAMNLGYANGMFFVFGYGGVWMTASSGAGWTPMSSLDDYVANSDSFRDIAFDGSRYVLAAVDGTTGAPKALSSADAPTGGPMTWIEHEIDPAYSDLSSMAYGDGYFVVVGTVYDADSNVHPGVYYSTDAENWISISEQKLGIAGSTLNDVYFKDGKFYAVGGDNAMVVLASDPVPVGDAPSLASVLGQNDLSPGGGTGTAADPITWSINVANSVTKLDMADIVPVAGSGTVYLYDDPDYAGTNSGGYSLSFLNLPEGGSSTAYIQIDSSDLFKSLYYAVTIHRAGAAADVTSPVLSGIDVSGITQSDAALKATSDENATLYYVLTTSATPPTAAQVVAGQNHLGATAIKSDNGAATAAAAKSFNVTGLTAGTHYYAYFVAKDSAGNASLVGSKDFTTTAAPLSDNAYLSNLIVNPGSLTFDPNTETYTVNVPYGTTSIDVTPTVADSGATVTVHGDSTTSGSARTITLDADGSTLIDVMVTAADGSTKSYKITVNETAPLNSTISPTTATFDLNSANTSAGHYQDVTTSMTLNGNELSSIKNGTTSLSLGTDYTVSDSTLTIKKTYLASQSVGTTTLTFHFSAGSTQTLAITVSDTTPIPASGLTVAAGDPSGASNDGKTKIEVGGMLPEGHKLMYVNFGSGTVVVPKVGDTLTGYDELPSNGLIPATDGDKVGVAEVDADGKVVRFGDATAVVTSEPKPDAPNVTADNDSNTIVGATAAMEYALNGGSWTAYDPGNPPVFPGTAEVLVRVAANSGTDKPAGETTTLNFTLNPPAAPSVSANDITNVITGINDSMEYAIDDGSWIAYNPASPPVLSGEHTVKVRVKASGSVPAGEEKVIAFTTNPPAAPSVSANDVANVITGIDVSMEYAIDDGNWVSYDSANPPVLSGEHTVKVRVKASGSVPAGEEKVITFTTNPPAAPSVMANDVTNVITGIYDSMEYAIDDGSWIAYNPASPPVLSGEHTVKVRVKASGSVPAGEEKVITFTPNPPAQPSVSANDVTNVITGIDDTMEYAIDDGSWIAYNPESPPVLSGEHTVKVRVKASGSVPAGEAKTIYFTINGTYNVLGTVVDDAPEANYSAGATVKVMKGNVQIGSTATTDAVGHFKATGVPNGTYNLVVTKDDQIITVAVTVKDQDYDFSPRFIVLPRGNKNSALEIKGDTPSIVVDGLNDLFADTQNVYTADDRQLVANGGSVKITLGVEKLGASAATGASQLQNLAGGQSLDLYLDMTLTKTRVDTSNQTTRSTLSTVGSLLKIIVPYDLAGKDNVTIYRYHDGAAQKLTLLPYSAVTPSTEGYMLDAEGNQIVIWAQNFSTYAVAYGTVGTPPVVGSTSASYTLTAIAGIGGSMSPSGAIAVTQGGSQTFAIKPDEGYVISDVTVDGKSVGAVDSYTFVSVTAAHTIKAEFSKIKAAGLPFYEEGGSKVFIGFATDASGTMKYIAPSGKTVQFEANPKAFRDIATHWGKSYIDFVTEREIFVGTNERTFSPDTGMTRAMLATVIGRLYERSYGPLSATDKHVFTDVDYDGWYGAYLDWAAGNGIIQGVGGTRFEPDRQVTRQELAAMLYRFAQFIKADTSVAADKTLSYSDASAIDAWARQAALYMQQSGIITGRSDNAFAPKETATRAEVAAMLQRFIETVV
ncbi:DUF4073 domain-containing protein [Cohnella ginsengisoli]|uniref:DUF4073 domain-containing protein n=1 Tax=Cohnella ginsengisoli TaxID=425004 RepID=A0A9X4QMY2_9BACL|nr:DUF4073 domain-containing protein [Cohnella ginsengisoli]MDG0792228.1 DUF4073 domain-containing protein [Cohnella ginsengisoli]